MADELTTVEAIKRFFNTPGYTTPVSTADLLTLRKQDNENGTEYYKWYAEKCAKALGVTLKNVTGVTK